jgi:hypothetical protein
VPLDDDIDELYGLPLDEFVAARNALVKRLKKEGDKDAATAVQALKKPSLAAWALNRLARDDPNAITELLEAGAAVRRAHRQALSGDATALRAATRTEQREVSGLAQRAAAILDGAGSSGAANLDRLATTLRAAATDEEAGEALRQSRMLTDLEASGFDLTGGLVLVPPPREEAAPGRRDGAAAAPPAATAEVEAGDEADAEARAEAAAAQAAAERQAKRERERAEAKVAAAAKKAERLEQEADRAEETAIAARQRAADARAAADEAAAELADLI